VLACRKCHQQLPEGLAQQSLCGLETILLARCSSIAAHRQAMNKGPLCDPCFARWQIAFQSGDRPRTGSKMPPLSLTERAKIDHRLREITMALDDMKRHRIWDARFEHALREERELLTGRLARSA